MNVARSGWSRVVRRHRVALIAVALLALALVLASPLPARWLVREVPLDAPDAILSLGSHERERFAEAAAQARRWPRAVVLLTTPAVLGPYNCDACPYRVGWLGTLGVPATRVRMLWPRSGNTHDEFVTAARWMQQHHLTRLLIVTSPYHTRRVQVLSNGALRGLQVGVVACRVGGGLSTLWWTRQYDRFYVRYELAALVAAWWRYGSPPWLPPVPRESIEAL